MNTTKSIIMPVDQMSADQMEIWREHAEILSEWNRLGLNTSKTGRTVANCINLGEMKLEIPGDAVDCKLNAVKLYACSKFNDVVTNGALIGSASVVSEWAKSKSLKYIARNCRNCNEYEVKEHEKQSKLTLSDVTVVITTFKRPDSLAILIASLNKFYPDVKLIVQDTEGNLSAGRNAGITKVDSELILLLDDDFEFTSNTTIETFLDVLNHDSDNEKELCGVAGTVIEPNGNLAWCHNFIVWRGESVLTASKDSWLATRKGTIYKTCDITLNFMLIRTEIARRVKWDEDLELNEHRDWFMRVNELKEWKFAWAPSATCMHNKARSVEYKKWRNRNFTKKAEKKHGLKFKKTSNIFFRKSNTLNSVKPQSIVLLGIGHSNTSITAKQLETLGYNLNDADEEFAESVSVRSLNTSAIKSGKLNISAAIKILNRWSKVGMWAVKDPRFVETLQLWLTVLCEHEPTLVWITKNLDDVKASYVRRGMPKHRSLKTKYKKCEKHFSMWPWRKIKIDATQVATACLMFSNERSFNGRETIQ